MKRRKLKHKHNSVSGFVVLTVCGDYRNVSCTGLEDGIRRGCLQDKDVCVRKVWLCKVCLYACNKEKTYACMCINMKYLSHFERKTS